MPDIRLLLDAASSARWNSRSVQLNTVAGPNSAGDIWMANDGGVYHANGARPASGMSTLATINVTGLAMKGYVPALQFGDDFYSPDEGTSWKNPQWDCGDCDAWFSDPVLTREVATFVPCVPGGGFSVYTNGTKCPDPNRIRQMERYVRSGCVQMIAMRAAHIGIGVFGPWFRLQRARPLPKTGTTS